MHTLIKLWQALSRLAANVSALADTVQAIDASLRLRAGLAGADPLLLPDSAGDSAGGTSLPGFHTFPRLSAVENVRLAALVLFRALSPAIAWRNACLTSLTRGASPRNCA
jgi:hypothetical protein